MSVATNDGSPFGVLGVFWVLLGAGVVLDGDWWLSGAALMAAGVWCMWKESNRTGRSEGIPR